MDPIILVLGDFTFQDMEIPESIPFGGGQMLSVKKQVGGTRIIDAMGADPDAIEWSGTFFPTQDGQSALDRALQLAQMRDAGLPLLLSWDQLLLMVLIKGFVPDYRFAHIPYKITCEVLQDLTTPSGIQGIPDADTVIDSDTYSLSQMLTDMTSEVTSAINSVISIANTISTYINAPQSLLSPLIQAVVGAMNVVSSRSSAVDSILSSASAPGGVSSASSITTNLAAYEAQLAANNEQTTLVKVQATLGRVLVNLKQTNSSIKTITVSGGNLFDVAAKQYGDPTAWTIIALANGLADPQLTGIVTLVIPPYNSTSNGVLTT